MNCPKCKHPLDPVTGLSPKGTVRYVCHVCRWGADRALGAPMPKEEKKSDWSNIPPARGFSFLIAWVVSLAIVFIPWAGVSLVLDEYFSKEFRDIFNVIYPPVVVLYSAICALNHPEAFSYRLSLLDRPFRGFPTSVDFYNGVVFMWSWVTFPGILICYAIYSTQKLFTTDPAD